jgi:hypothetical protein
LHTSDAIPENPVGEMLFGLKNTLNAIPIKNVPPTIKIMLIIS